MQTLKDYKKLHTIIPEQKFHYIPNGYNGQLLQWQGINSNSNQFTIGYVGSFYYSANARNEMLKPWWRKRGHRMLHYIPHKQDWLYRTPYFFFKALDQFKSEYPLLASKIRVKFVGKKVPWLTDMINEFALKNQVELLGEVSHQDSILFQKECDALLITSAKQYNGKDYSIAGKTFEYFQMQKPIIAFVCEGAQKDILNEASTAIVFDPDNTVESVKKFHDLFTGKVNLQPNNNFLRVLSRESLTGQLAKVIKEII
jgi:hypothetical protein